MKHLKLFFALFAMLALGAGTAWGEKITNYSNLESGKSYYIGATLSTTDYYFSCDYSTVKEGVKGVAQTDKANATIVTAIGSGTSWAFKFDNGKYLSLKNSKDNGKVSIVSSEAKWTLKNSNSLINMKINGYCLQRNNQTTTTNFGSYESGQKDIWFELVEVGGSEPETPVVTIELDKTEATLNLEETLTLNATVENSEETIVWASDKESVATVSNGVVTAIGAGKANITATVEGVTATCVVTVKDPNAPAWTLVTNASTLKAGDKIVIAGTGDNSNYALSTAQKSNNRGAVAATKTDDKIEEVDNMQILTLETGTKTGTFAFNTGSGYLYAASSSQNYLRTQTQNNDNGSWKIAIADGVATVVAQGTNTRNTMRYNYNNGSPLFAAYASSSTTGALVAIYTQAKPAGTPDAPTLTASQEFETETFTVEISAVDGATIHYTLDGTDPTKASTTYSVPFTISATTTVKAIAVKDGVASNVATATYTKVSVIEKTCAEAAALCTSTESTDKYRVEGYVTAIETAYSAQYNNITVWMADTRNGGNVLQAFRATPTVDVDKAVKVGDKIEVVGKLKLYESTTPEIISGTYTITQLDPVYNVNITSAHGTAAATPASAVEGTEITLSVEVESGWVFQSWTVTDASSTPIEVVDDKFTMPASDVTVVANYTESEAPDSKLNLSANGVVTSNTYKVGETVKLPETIVNDCVKMFVGWSADASCATTPEYAPGADFELTAEEHTLYAVYATGVVGEVVTQTLTITDQTTNSTYRNNSFTDNKGGVWSGQSNIPDATHFGLRQNDDNTHMASPVFPNNIINITAKIRNQSKSERKVYLCSNNTTAKPSSGDLGGVNVNGSVTDIEHTFTLNGTFNQFYIYTNGALQFNEIEVTYSSAPTYSNYSTTCAAAPKAEVNPTEVTAIAAGVEGKVTVTYENVNTENVSVALYNDDACTEAFTAGWLTASIDADKNIAYTVAENTTYAERKAYIQLTAPDAAAATDPAVVVIPVTQAAKDKVFASLEALLAAITPTTEGVEVTVTLTNEVIQDFYTSGSYRNGVKLNVPYQGNTKAIEIYCKDVPAEWVKGGKLSGTITCPWKLYNSTWELCPTAWTELTYAAPPTVSSIAVSGTPTKTTYIDGEEFDPAGLVVTATYTDASTEVVNAALVDWTFNPEILTKGLTSVQVTATYNTLTSAAYSVNVTVNDIPTKTVAEFIAAEGGRCYLEGIVSNITNTTYGNFDLTDASGKIYIYGCLDASGVAQKFATLGVKEGDKIKVIADVYELYQGTKQEAKNVQYVSHISAATITIANITMEVGETKTIAATIVPAEAEVTYTIKENAANAISLSDNVITALAEGTATITATVAEGATYLSNSVDFKVTVTPQNIATLPFAFDGGVNDIKNTLGMSQKNLGIDYGSSPKLKFDDKDDYVIIHFDERPGILTYDIKANTGSGAFSGEFAVQESADGVTYRNLAVYETISGSKESKAHNCFDKDTRYIKFIFTTKGNGNVALGNIKIEKSVVTKVTPTIVENAYFSVGNNKYVQFSTGNLQYEVGTNTWSFASEQYEVVGGATYDPANPTNTNYGMNEPGYTGKLDLFGWSSDGKFGVNPSNTDADYGTDGVNEFVDWGTLVNETGWSTLTKEEMNYILNRKKDGKKLWALATVCGMNGLILLPDNWNTSITLDYGYVPANFNYTKNQIDDATWQTLEDAGAVFLPEGGTRVGGHGNKEQGGGPDEFDAHRDYFHVDNVNEMGYYWLNTQDTRTEYLNCASFLILPGWSDNGTPNDESDDKAHAPQVWSREKRRGNSVRLVKEVTPNYTRDKQGAGVYGTVCYPENIVWCDGATLYEVAGKEGNKVIFDEVTTPEAGIPYIFIADQEVINFFCGTEYEGTAGKHNSLQGTFTQIDPAVDNILVGNYMLVNNIIKKCGINCGLYANRAYFVATELENMGTAPAAVQGRRRISLDVASENTTTGIDNITNGENTTIKVIENGQLIIIRNGEKYNAMGVKL